MDVSCTQCGAALSVAADARLIACSFCDTALVVDAAGVLFREVMLPTVKAGDVHAHLRRFLGGSATVANLDSEAALQPAELQYFPFWAFTVGGEAGERVLLMPACPSSLQGLQGIGLPAGQTVKAVAGATGEVPMREPEVPLETAREWLVSSHGKMPILRTVLYHLPLYRVAYEWRGRSYRAAVDGVSGKVFPADFPAKAEAPYLLVTALALLVFGIEGLVVENLIAKLLLYAVSAPPILAVAWWTSRKV